MSFGDGQVDDTFRFFYLFYITNPTYLGIRSLPDRPPTAVVYGFVVVTAGAIVTFLVCGCVLAGFSFPK